MDLLDLCFSLLSQSNALFLLNFSCRDLLTEKNCDQSYRYHDLNPIRKLIIQQQQKAHTLANVPLLLPPYSLGEI